MNSLLPLSSAINQIKSFTTSAASHRYLGRLVAPLSTLALVGSVPLIAIVGYKALQYTRSLFQSYNALDAAKAKYNQVSHSISEGGALYEQEKLLRTQYDQAVDDYLIDPVVKKVMEAKQRIIERGGTEVKVALENQLRRAFLEKHPSQRLPSETDVTLDLQKKQDRKILRELSFKEHINGTYQFYDNLRRFYEDTWSGCHADLFKSYLALTAKCKEQLESQQALQEAEASLIAPNGTLKKELTDAEQNLKAYFFGRVFIHITPRVVFANVTLIGLVALNLVSFKLGALALISIAAYKTVHQWQTSKPAFLKKSATIEAKQATFEQIKASVSEGGQLFEKDRIAAEEYAQAVEQCENDKNRRALKDAERRFIEAAKEFGKSAEILVNHQIERVWFDQFSPFDSQSDQSKSMKAQLSLEIKQTEQTLQQKLRMFSAAKKSEWDKARENLLSLQKDHLKSIVRLEYKVNQLDAAREEAERNLQEAQALIAPDGILTKELESAKQA